MLNFSSYGSSKRVFEFFEEISKIPHGSSHTGKIADYLVSFAKSRNLYVRKDEANNVIIKKKATKGLENRPTVIIQGHTDMVLEKSADSNINMLEDGLDLYIDGDFLRAKGTTLGGDDGIAVAYALALLDSEDIPHPEIEAIFTSDEEIGLLGAVALEPYDIGGRIMLNIDSDSEGIFTAGCAGGVRLDINLPITRKEKTENATKIKLYGLKGGHSGVEINKGRENAVKILAELLLMINTDTRVKISSFSGGNADNAIPRAAECIVAFEKGVSLHEYTKKIIEKYKTIEPDIAIEFEDYHGELSLINEEESENLISLLNSVPSGVIKMSEDIPTLVETSLNLGIIRDSENSILITFSIRSSLGKEKENLLTRVTKTAENHGATCSTHGAYPAWEYKKESQLRNVMCRVYRDMYGEDAEVITIHAGLECGIFSDKLEGLDCVSIGPDNFDIHTTEERLSISSTIRVWEFIKEVLKNI